MLCIILFHNSTASSDDVNNWYFSVGARNKVIRCLEHFSMTNVIAVLYCDYLDVIVLR